MAAPIYRNEFEERMRDIVGFMRTTIEAAKSDINANTDAKFAAVIKHYDEQLSTLTKQYDELRNEVASLKEEGARRERKLDAVLKALNVSIEDI